MRLAEDKESDGQISQRFEENKYIGIAAFPGSMKTTRNIYL